MGKDRGDPAMNRAPGRYSGDLHPGRESACCRGHGENKYRSFPMGDNMPSRPVIHHGESTPWAARFSEEAKSRRCAMDKKGSR
jgi:hypothetical protein